MILRILVLFCAISFCPSLGKMSVTKFNQIGENCFRNEEKEPFRVNGQDTPLSNTLENFIAMAEKFEAANPSFDLKNELVYYISEYVYENIKIVNGRTAQWKIDLANMKLIDSMWDPDLGGYNPSYIDPFTQDEKCSLYYMISHSILSKDKELSRFYSPGNFSSSSTSRTEDLNPEEYRPQELGVVAIRGTDAAVSLSKVLIGMFVGLKQNRKVDVTQYEGIEIPQDVNIQDKTVDELYAVTLADVLMQARWAGSDRRGLAPNGRWVSIPIDPKTNIDGFCPMVYLQQKDEKLNLPTQSYSSVRGAVDGLILGSIAQPLYEKKQSAKLSQILRMYYSPDGIPLDSKIEDLNDVRISFCNRQTLIEPAERKLENQMLLYGHLIAENPKDIDQALGEAKSMYARERLDIIRNSNTELQQFCERPLSLERPEDLPRDILLHVIAVMDSRDEATFRRQQMIIGYLAKQLDLRYAGSRMTILLDQRISSSSGSSSEIDLKPVVFDTYSSSCAACVVGQIEYEQSTMERDQVITGIDHFLLETKENETKYSAVNGKVVLYFNYETENVRGNNKVQGRLQKALRDLHLHHIDALFFAVGMDSEVLRRYAKNDASLTFFGTDDSEELVAKNIYLRISNAPANLQYKDCKDGKNENSAVVENFVSPYTVQHYQMPAENFYKSTSIIVTFEASRNGFVRVCHNRGTKKPEDVGKTCKDTTGGQNGNAEFKFSNPCQGFTKENCSPFFFSVIGMDSNNKDMKQPDTGTRAYCNDLQDKWCRTLDQVYFKVSHTGIRCSGCLGLGAPPAFILLAALATFFIYKRF